MLAETVDGIVMNRSPLQTNLTRPVALLALCLSGASAIAAAETAEQIISKMNNAEEQRQSHLREYWGSRKYILKNDRWNKNAEMQVEVQYRKGQGKAFQLLASTGSEEVQNRVFKKLIDAESEASRSNQPDPSRLTADNYNFKLAGMEQREGRRCYVVLLSPKKKSKFLLEGKAWIDADDYAVVRLEGRPSANISFWVGRPYIVQNFAKIGGQWLSSSNHSSADSHFFGRTELHIEYTRYSVNGSGAVRVAARTPAHTDKDSLD